jgi:NADPH-dependent 2,4-dienoyl-CoA reductase/sulfur reductase-like enzyme/nitrite reductase/ring-hydroxylating ferredoxin subunit
MDHCISDLTAIPDGGMRAFDFEGHCILLSRDGNRVMAVSGHCVHEGAPLADGVRVGNRVICPWHHAMFDLATGEHLQPPGEGRLRSFKTRVENGKVYVQLRNEDAKNAQLDEIDQGSAKRYDKIFAIVGAGASGRSAAEELRRQGFDGRIKLYSMEEDAPYDRTALSKSFLAGEQPAEKLELLTKRKLRDKGVELLLGHEITRVVHSDRKLIFSDGNELRYSACLAATGSAAYRPDIPGANFPGVYTLRSKADGIHLLDAAARVQEIVIIGSGFIGLETAAVFTAQKKSVTVVTPDPKPFARIFGEEIAAALLAAHRAAGTTILLDSPVVEIEERNGRASGIRLASGRSIPADLILLGTGAKPRIDMIEGAAKSSDGGIVADETLKAADNLWIAGDIASFPSHFAFGKNIRIEHWRVAEQLGRHAARAMLGDKSPFFGIPFFWTLQNWQINLVGLTGEFDDVHIEGQLTDGSFMAYFVRGDHIVAGLGAGEGDKTAALHALFLGGELPLARTLADAGWEPTKLPIARVLRAA